MKRTVTLQLLCKEHHTVEVDFPVYTKSYGSSEYRETTFYWKHNYDDTLICLEVSHDNDGSEDRYELTVQRDVKFSGNSGCLESSEAEFLAALEKMKAAVLSSHGA